MLEGLFLLAADACGGQCPLGEAGIGGKVDVVQFFWSRRKSETSSDRNSGGPWVGLDPVAGIQSFKIDMDPGSRGATAIETFYKFVKIKKEVNCEAES